MNNLTKRSVRTVAWSALLLMLSILVMTCALSLGVAAADGDTYTLKLTATLYDENGEEWPVGIQTELAEGEAIDTDALFAQLIAHYPHLAGTVLSDEGFDGLPADWNQASAMPEPEEEDFDEPEEELEMCADDIRRKINTPGFSKSGVF